jgi:hypothetical protein
MSESSVQVARETLQLRNAAFHQKRIAARRRAVAAPKRLRASGAGNRLQQEGATARLPARLSAALGWSGFTRGLRCGRPGLLRDAKQTS